MVHTDIIGVGTRGLEDSTMASLETLCMSDAQKE
jgi:hypothetical protein